MRCLKLNKVLIAAYAAHHLSQPEAERVETHLRTCNSCRGLAEDLERSSLALRELQVEPEDDRLRQIRARVLDRISAQEQLPERPSIWRWPAGRQWVVGWQMGYVASIAFLLSVGALLFWNSLRHHSTGPLAVQMQHPQTRPQPSSQTLPDTRVPERSFNTVPPPGSAAVSPRKYQPGSQSDHSSSQPGTSLPSPIVVAEAPYATTPMGATPARDLPYPSPTIPAPQAPTMGAARPEVFGSQDQAPKGSLIDQLQTAYPLTILDATGYKVSKPGTTLEIQLDGIQANPMKSPPFQNTFEDGQVVAGGHSTVSKFMPGGLGKRPFESAPRTLAAKEKVYLLKMEAKDDAVIFTVQTCGTCDPAAIDPTHKPFVASILFKFIKGFLAATDLKHVQDAIGALLVVPDAGAAANAQPAADAAQQSAPPAAPRTQQPPARAAAPDPAVKSAPIQEPPLPQPKIEKGLTINQVLAQLGQPETIVTLGDKRIYLFKEWKVTFIGGKVTDIDVR